MLRTMTQTVAHHAAVVSSLVASTLGAWRGTLVLHAATQPPLPITLYDMEACPYCRKVREALTAFVDQQLRSDDRTQPRRQAHLDQQAEMRPQRHAADPRSHLDGCDRVHN